MYKDFSYILNMLDAIGKIEEYTLTFTNAEAFYNHSQAFDATLMNFIVIGEMVEKLSEELLLNTGKNIDWNRVKGFRNIIAHNYFGIDAEEVWQIIQKSLPELKNVLTQIVS
jgi:uncharacterized protein with HEPN domain